MGRSVFFQLIANGRLCLSAATLAATSLYCKGVVPLYTVKGYSRCSNDAIPSNKTGTPSKNHYKNYNTTNDAVKRSMSAVTSGNLPSLCPSSCTGARRFRRCFFCCAGQHLLVLLQHRRLHAGRRHPTSERIVEGAHLRPTYLRHG